MTYEGEEQGERFRTVTALYLVLPPYLALNYIKEFRQ